MWHIPSSQCNGVSTDGADLVPVPGAVYDVSMDCQPVFIIRSAHALTWAPSILCHGWEAWTMSGKNWWCQISDYWKNFSCTSQPIVDFYSASMHCSAVLPIGLVLCTIIHGMLWFAGLGSVCQGWCWATLLSSGWEESVLTQRSVPANWMFVITVQHDESKACAEPWAVRMDGWMDGRWL